MRTVLQRVAVLLLCAGSTIPAQVSSGPQARILDLDFYSQVFAEQRNFRIFLPLDYDQATGKRYPVIYFFHGWSERHNRPPRERSGYDSGASYGGDTIAAFVGQHDVIVVRWDGWNPRTPGEDYVRPYNISPVETNRQFPLYFPELVRHIDSRFRTIADREHRATAGLSMGGFMSFWIAGKYPHLIGSASNFMGSSEFFVGPKEFPTEYRHTEMYRNYEGMPTRIVLGSRDFIRWYHHRMNAVWDFTRPHHEHEEFDSEHGVPGMAKTLGFHMRAFDNPLPKPDLWHHSDVYPEFDVWGYSISTDRRKPGYTVLENVSRRGFRSSVRDWLPGGKLQPEVNVNIVTDSLYRPRQRYKVTDVNLDTGAVRQFQLAADHDGRLHFPLNGARHEVGIAERAEPVLTAADWEITGTLWAVAGKPSRLKLKFLNKGSVKSMKAAAVVTTPNPGVEVEQGRVRLPVLEPGKQAAGMDEIRFVVRDPTREIVQLKVRIGGGLDLPVEVPLFRNAPVLADYRIMDGAKLPLWERAVERKEKSLGSGNGDGKAQPGETVVLALLDGVAWRAAELFTSDACADLTERLSDEWGAYDHVGATAKISLLRISASCPQGHEIPLFVRYQIPNRPEHILKEGIVNLRMGTKP